MQISLSVKKAGIIYTKALNKVHCPDEIKVYEAPGNRQTASPFFNVILLFNTTPPSVTSNISSDPDTLL